jgi:S-adenosylmethionine-dependent methyltransferase
MSPDANFDDIAAVFEDEIYGSSKGSVRLHVLWEDLLASIPRLADGDLSVLDAGGGAGHMAARLASLGNEVVLCDPSQEMLDRAQRVIHKAQLADAITTVRSTIQELPGLLDRSFDVITCHAVLEWLSNPRDALAQLTRFLKVDGQLSLMFYNRNATLLKRILSGAFADALHEYQAGPAPRGWGDGATALAEEAVREWLAGVGLAVRSKAGIRIFHDHVPEALRPPDRLDDLLTLELSLRGQEPFASLGQHIHLVCERAPQGTPSE